MNLDLNAIRARLEQMRAQYQATIADMTTGDEATPSSDPVHEGDISDDPADDADQLYEAERQKALAANARDQLDLVETALARLDDGTYGRCLICGNPIDERRLKALPQAQYCLADQERIERQTTGA